MVRKGNRQHKKARSDSRVRTKHLEPLALVYNQPNLERLKALRESRSRPNSAQSNSTGQAAIAAFEFLDYLLFQ